MVLTKARLLKHDLHFHGVGLRKRYKTRGLGQSTPLVKVLWVVTDLANSNLSLERVHFFWGPNWVTFGILGLFFEDFGRKMARSFYF